MNSPTQSFLNDSFCKACAEGDLDKVKSLLTSPDLELHADIYADEELGFRNACFGGHLPVIRYLLDSPKLKHHPKLHADQEWLITNALENGYLDLLHYYIFERKMPKTEFITNYLFYEKNEQVEQWFKIRDLNQQLQTNLPNETVKEKKKKI